MTTSSWYAELALRILVRKSAIGSVMVMVGRAFLAWFPCAGRAGPAPVTTRTTQCLALFRWRSQRR